MSTQTIKTVALVDDIDGGDAEGSYTFFVDGTEYAIDLSADNAETLADALADFRDAMATFVANARPAKGGKVRNDQTAIREWAKAQGLPVGARGRISAEVLEAYTTANA